MYKLISGHKYRLQIGLIECNSSWSVKQLPALRPVSDFYIIFIAPMSMEMSMPDDL